MLYEFALIHDVFDPATLNPDAGLRVALTEILRGIERNGLIANLHKERWLKHISEDLIPQISPSTRDVIIAALGQLDNRHRIVRHPKNPGCDPASNREWLDTAELSNAQVPFQGIVLTNSLLATLGNPGANLMELSQVLNSAQWTGRKNTTPIQLSEADFRRKLSPVLRFARTVTVVDPYLSPTDDVKFPGGTEVRKVGENMRFVELIAGLLGNRNGGIVPGRIILHASADSQNLEPPDVAIHLGIWKTKLGQLKGKFNHAFTVCYWENRGSKVMHDRFILTDQCGIGSQDSFKCQYRQSPTSTIWSLLDEDDRVAMLSEFDAANPAYDFVDTYESN
jgi:hypothetical protein